MCFVVEVFDCRCCWACGSFPAAEVRPTSSRRPSDGYAHYYYHGVSTAAAAASAPTASTAATVIIIITISISTAAVRAVEAPPWIRTLQLLRAIATSMLSTLLFGSNSCGRRIASRRVASPPSETKPTSVSTNRPKFTKRKAEQQDPDFAIDSAPVAVNGSAVNEGRVKRAAHSIAVAIASARWCNFLNPLRCSGGCQQLCLCRGRYWYWCQLMLIWPVAVESTGDVRFEGLLRWNPVGDAGPRPQTPCCWLGLPEFPAWSATTGFVCGWWLVVGWLLSVSRRCSRSSSSASRPSEQAFLATHYMMVARSACEAVRGCRCRADADVFRGAAVRIKYGKRSNKRRWRVAVTGTQHEKIVTRGGKGA